MTHNCSTVTILEDDDVVGSLKMRAESCCSSPHTLEKWPRMKGPHGARHPACSPFSSISLNCYCNNEIASRGDGGTFDLHKWKKKKSQAKGRIWQRWSKHGLFYNMGPGPLSLPLNLSGLPTSLIRFHCHAPFISPMLCSLPAPLPCWWHCWWWYTMTPKACADPCSLISPALLTPFSPSGYS